MIAEMIITRMHWDIWHATSLADKVFDLLGGPRFCVGTWTGPDKDLVCTRTCYTKEQAEAALSPAGWTITHATLLSLKKELGIVLRESLGMTWPA